MRDMCVSVCLVTDTRYQLCNLISCDNTNLFYI